MRDTIVMAREAGFIHWEQFPVDYQNKIKTLVALARADEREQYKWDVHSCGPTCKRYACVAMREAIEAEREACAKVADQSMRDSEGKSFGVGDAIRARGNT